MEGIKQKSKRYGRVWKHRALIPLGLFLFFLVENSLAKPIPTTTVSKTYPYRSSKKILTARLSSSRQKPPSNGKASSRSSSTKRRQKARQKARQKNGYKVSYVKPGGLLDKIRIKKGDTIKQLAGRPVYSKKQIRKRIVAISKKQKGFSLWLERNRKSFLVSYKVSSLKPGGIKISKVKKMNNLRRRPFQKSKRRIASTPSAKKALVRKNPVKKDPAKKVVASKKGAKLGLKKIKRSQPSLKAKNLKEHNKTATPPLILKKYQENLQRAYVIAAYSIIYKQADFDSDKIHSLHKGSKIIISKKIFRPAHNFGSFYKVFLSSPKKVVGYISEVDLAPEFIKKEDQETPNPAYLLARKQLKEGKVLDVGFSPQDHSLIGKKKKGEGRSSSPSRHYLGLFTGFSGFQPEEKDIFVGLKLSGYGLLISSLNMDINLSISPYDFKFFHFDILVSLPLMRTRLAQLFIMGGLKFDINKRIEDIERRNDPGFAGAASLIFPFRSFLLFRLEAKTEYGLASREVQTNFSAVLQAGF